MSSKEIPSVGNCHEVDTPGSAESARCFNLLRR